MLIRPMVSTDIPAIFAIEQTVQVSSWSLQMFEDSLKHRDLGWVLVNENELRGYMLVKPVLNYPEADILTIAVAQEQQRKGYGQALLTFLLTQFSCLYLEVRVSNKPAIALYEKCGFKTIGTRPKYYQGEDARVMQLNQCK